MDQGRMLTCFVGGVGWPERRASVRRSSLICCARFGERIAAGVAGAAIGWTVLTQGPVGVSLADLNNDIVHEASEIVRRNSLYADVNNVNRFAEEVDLLSLSSKDEAFAQIRRLLKSLQDKYARFLTPEQFNKLSKYDVTGLGLLLTTDLDGKFVVATAPPPSSSAGKLGVLQGDVVEGIAGERTDGMTAMHALELLQGNDGSKVSVVLRSSNEAAREVELERQVVVDNPVTYKVKVVGERRLGYIRLKEFNAASNNAVRDAIENLEKQNVEAYVLDLRANLGGVVEGALDIAGLFMHRDVPAVRVRDRNGSESVLYAKEVGKRDLLTKPMVVVTDRRSASASEVLLVALRDNCRALSVGETSYGKGVIQGVFGLSDGSAVVLTVAKYVAPKGGEINLVGVKPDVEVRQPSRYMDARLDGVDFGRVQEKLGMCQPAS